MNLLDNPKVLAAYERSLVPTSLAWLSRQVNESWQSAQASKLPKNYSQSKNIVFCGLGGSALAAEVLTKLYCQEIALPVYLLRDYHLPAYVNKDSLVVISSYSGNTEEALNCFSEALKKKAKIICLAGGGQLIAWANKAKIPCFKLATDNNPSGQPRYAVGSQFGALLALMAKLKIIKSPAKELAVALRELEFFGKLFVPRSPFAGNPAKFLAAKLSGFAPVVIAAEFLSANAHILANQINESAKNLAFYYLLPELNHHLLEGLKLPPAALGRVKFLFLDADNYSEKIKQRVKVTEQVLQKKNLSFIEYRLSGTNNLAAVLEVLSLGSWLSFYLAILNKENPATVPWVDYFKRELAKQ